MSGMNAAAPDPAQELGAEDEVTAFNNEEEGEYEGDESLNDIKDELQLEADSDKTKVRACVSTCALGPCAFCAAAYIYCCCLCVTPADVLWTPTSYYRLVASGAGASEWTLWSMPLMSLFITSPVTAQAFPVNQPTFLVCCL